MLASYFLISLLLENANKILRFCKMAVKNKHYNMFLLIWFITNNIWRNYRHFKPVIWIISQIEKSKAHYNCNSKKHGCVVGKFIKVPIKNVVSISNPVLQIIFGSIYSGTLNNPIDKSTNDFNLLFFLKTFYFFLLRLYLSVI